MGTPGTPLTPPTPLTPLGPSTGAGERDSPASSTDSTDEGQYFQLENSAASPKLCSQCLPNSQTYLIELINYPALEHSKIRQQVLSKGEYDAVLLLYDVGNRSTFECVRVIHSELSEAVSRQRRPSATLLGRRASSTVLAQHGRRGSLLSMFSATEDSRRELYGSTKSETTIVALVGNKCDIDNEEGSSIAVKPVYSMKKQKGDNDDEVAIFGVSIDSGCSEPSTTSTDDSSIQQRPNILRSRRSYPRMNDWLHIETRAKRLIDGLASGQHESALAHNKPPNPSQGTAVTIVRQVSAAEGQGLAFELGLQVPFMETSAKTGANVEEAVEAVVQAVLRRKGRDVPERKLKRSYRQRQSPASKPSVTIRVECPLIKPAPPVASHGSQDQNPQRQAEANFLSNDGELEPRSEPQTANIFSRRHQVRRRESMGEKMRNLFMKRHASGATNLAA